MKRLGFAATLIGAVVIAAGAAQAKELTASIWFPDSHPLTKYGYVKWAPEVKKASGGDLTVKVYTGQAILPAAAHLSGLSDGIVDMTYHAGTYTPAELPQDNVLAMLGIGLSGPIVVASAVSDFYMNDPAMQKMFAQHGIVFLGGYATPPYILMCTKKITTLAEIKGKKIRTPGAVHADWIRQIGAVPISVPSTEMFTGLQRGQLDCAANAANDLKSRSLWDVAKHVTLLDLGSYFSGWLYAINGDTWRGLSDAQRRILLDAVPDGIVDTEIAYAAQSDEALAEASNHGVTIYEPADDLKKALQEFIDNQAQEIATRQGAEQFELTDPGGLIDRFKQTLEKWRKLYASVDLNDHAAVKKVLHENLYSAVDESSYGM